MEAMIKGSLTKSSNEPKFSSKMQQGNKKTNLIQQRSKWGDWSKCTENCMKTRHRRNCDDILAQNSTQAQHQHKQPNNKPLNQVNKRIERQDDLLVDRSDQDDEDYADEGDDEDERDSCENVDTNIKTFETKPCYEDLCLLPPPKDYQYTITTLPSASGTTRHSAPRRLAKVDTSSYRDDKYAKRHRVPSGGDLLPAGHSNATLIEANSNGTNIIWTRNMWPQTLFNSELGPQAYFIQWTILIGSLLTIILLIMLIIRKLFVSTFPSYHWMLAKQTIKSSSSSDDCCQSHRHRRSSSLAYNPTSLVVETDPTRHALSSIQPHHRCYAWQPFHEPTKTNARPLSGSYKCVVNAAGKHYIGSSMSKFNTDIQPDLQGFYVEPSISNSSSSASHRARRARIETEELQQDGHSVISNNYNYDTLNSNYGNQLHDDKGFVLTRDFISHNGTKSTNESTNCPIAVARKSSASIDCSPISEAALVGTKKAAIHLEESSQTTKHRSPNVPNKVSDRNRDERTANSSNSRSSSISSADDSPTSIQSSTVQMLSNAASSSFELPPEFADCSTPITCSKLSMASPSSLNRKARLKLGKLTLVPQTVQSQPNSPMFANQFSNRATKLRSMNDRGSKFSAPKLRQCNGQDDGELDYAQAEQVESSNEARSLSKHMEQGDVMNMVRSIEASQDCDNNDDRHYYEEISQPRHLR